MRFLLLWRESRRTGRTIRRIVGIMARLQEQVKEFQSEGWHVSVLWVGCNSLVV